MAQNIFQQLIQDEIKRRMGTDNETDYVKKLKNQTIKEK